MVKVSERLNYLLTALPLKINMFTEEEFSTKPLNKWSKKEILGHLCDSAINNQQRFIRIQYEKQPLLVLPYSQDDWVAIQDYQNMPTADIVALWLALNRQIARVISRIPEEKLAYQCDFGDHKYLTLLELIQDYLQHLDHHLRQIFGTSEL